MSQRELPQSTRKRSSKRTPSSSSSRLPTNMMRAANTIEFYIEHASELAMQRPRVVALYQRFASAAAQPGSHDGMQQMAETWRNLLKL